MMSLRTMWHVGKNSKDNIISNSKRYSPWKELRFNHYRDIMKKDVVVICHRNPMSAVEYESFKFELNKMDWKCTIIQSGIMNVVLNDLKLKLSLHGPTMALYGNLDNFEKLRIPKDIIPMSVKVEKQCLDIKAMKQVLQIKHSQSHLVSLMETPAQKLLQSLSSTSNKLVFGLDSISKK